MCTGRPPFRAETTFGVLRRIRETQPRPIREINPDIPEWLDRVVMKLLSKSSDDRMATATEVSALLEQCLAHVQQPTTVEVPQIIAEWVRLPVPEVPTVRSFKGFQRPWSWFALAMALLLAIVLAVTRPGVKPIPSEHSETITESPSLDPLLEWNALQTELDDTASVVEQLDADAKRDLE